jgi:asparagine synthase (glutamine-hydrolysing)
VICRHFDIEARFPFYDKELAAAVFAIPLEERMHDRELKKIVLREAGKMLGAPQAALKRKKKAMQYGSGVHKIIMKRADEINRLYP